jgi:diadenosine tetraphosphate (Ap4A) HIT family hydrolase
MPTVFTRIINGELPGQFVWTDEACVAFLSINPIRRGHALIVPRAEVDHWIDLEPGLAAHLMGVAQHVAKAQQAAFRPVRVGMIIAGFEVPHTHLHVIPVEDMGGLDFANAATSVDPAELAAAAEAIRAELRRAGHGPNVA